MNNLLEKWKQKWFSSKLYSFEENFDDSLKEEIKKNKQSKTFFTNEQIRNIKKNVFSIDTPPPTVSGTLHIGHVFSYSHADFIARYKRMTGKDVFYPIGFDDNGLPTERLVEKIKKIRGIDYFKAGRKEEFIKECKSVIDSSEKDFEKLFQDLGYSFDWSKKYQTISKETQKISHYSFLDLFDKNLIYFSNKPTYWDCEDQTAIAQTEIEDAERPAKEFYLKFEFEDKTFTFESQNYLEIMTTRPELLCNCYAVFINPEDARVNQLKGKELIVPYFNKIVKILTDNDVAIDKGTGIVMCCAYGNMQDYVWLNRHRKDFTTQNDRVFWNKSRLYLDIESSINDHFTNEIRDYLPNIISKDGKIVHEFFKKEDLTPPGVSYGNCTLPHGDGCDNISSLDKNTGRGYSNIKQAQKKIVDKLTELNLLIPEKTKEITQIVKIAERSKTPLEILSTSQCYLKLLDFKEDFLYLAQNYLDFYPTHLKNRLIQWIEGINQDWCISRNRFIGINPPKINEIYEKTNILKEIEKYHVNLCKKDLENAKETIRTEQEMLQVKCALFNNYQEIFKDKFEDKLNFVFDTWFTSSVSPQINSRFISENFKDEEFLDNNLNFNDFIYPFSIRPQAHEIIRTWTFTTMAKAYLHGLTKEEFQDRQVLLETPDNLDKSDKIEKWFKKFTKEEIQNRFLPWKDVILSGWCLAEDKTKMSKSKGNIVDPVNLLKDKSADSIRYWAASSSLGADTPFNNEKVENGRKLVNKLQNAFKFISMQFDALQNSSNLLFKSELNQLKEITNGYLFDQYYIFKFHSILEEYEKFMEKYEFSKAKEIIEDFFWKDFCDNYLEIIKTRSYGLNALIYKDKNLTQEEIDKILQGQKSAILTLIYLFEGILKLFSPFLPFITEEINEAILAKNNQEWHEKNSIHRKGNWFTDRMFKFESIKDVEYTLEVLDFVRKEKSVHNLSIKTEVKELKISKPIHENLMNDFSNVINLTGSILISEKEEISIKLSI